MTINPQAGRTPPVTSDDRAVTMTTTDPTQVITHRDVDIVKQRDGQQAPR